MMNAKNWEAVAALEKYSNIVLRRYPYVFKGENADLDVAYANVEVTPDRVKKALEPLKMPTYCDGGTIRVMSDVWDSCRGCGGCRAGAAVTGAWAISAFVWSVANGAELSRLAACNAGFEALVAVGKAVAAALSPGVAIAKFFAATVALWNEIGKGMTVKVTGKRGNAKAHTGKVGIVKWIGESDYQPFGARAYRGRTAAPTTTTVRVGLEIAGAEKLVYVPLSSVERVAVPGETEAAIAKAKATTVAKARPNYRGAVGRKGSIGMIVAGKFKGKSGLVFWSGVKNGEQRLGLKDPTDTDLEPMWCSARDVVGPAAYHPTSGTPEELTAAIEHAEMNVLALSEAGFDKASQEWAAVFKKLASAA